MLCYLINVIIKRDVNVWPINEVTVHQRISLKVLQVSLKSHIAGLYRMWQLHDSLIIFHPFLTYSLDHLDVPSPCNSYTKITINIIIRGMWMCAIMRLQCIKEFHTVPSILKSLLQDVLEWQSWLPHFFHPFLTYWLDHLDVPTLARSLNSLPGLSHPY